MNRVLPLVGCLLVLVGLLVLDAPPLSAADEARDALADLKKTLRRGDPQEKEKALKRVERAARSMSETQRRAAAVSVRKALPKERDENVKARMVRTLAHLGGKTGWVPVINAWLEGRDPAMKGAARQALLWGGGDYLDAVATLLKEEKDPTWRARLLLLLGDRRRPDAVPLLLTWLAADHARVTSGAAEALEAITGQAFGYDLAKWTAWWAANAKRLLAPPEPTNGNDGETVPSDLETTYPEPKPHVTQRLWPEFYDLKLTAKDIVFVLDISGSVGTGGVARAKGQLIRAVEALGSDVSIAALFFEETVKMWKPEMVKATPAHKAELARFLRGIEPGKKTDVFTPLNAGLQIVRRRLEAKQKAGEPIREAITMIVVSDGVETHRQTPPSVVADKLDRLDPEHTVIHAVALGSKVSPLMMELARRGGGHYVQAR